MLKSKVELDTKRSSEQLTSSPEDNTTQDKKSKLAQAQRSLKQVLSAISERDRKTTNEKDKEENNSHHYFINDNFAAISKEGKDKHNQTQPQSETDRLRQTQTNTDRQSRTQKGTE